MEKFVKVNKHVGRRCFFVVPNRDMPQKLDMNATLLFVTLELSATPNIFYWKVRRFRKKIQLAT